MNNEEMTRFLRGYLLCNGSERLMDRHGGLCFKIIDPFYGKFIQTF